MPRTIELLAYKFDELDPKVQTKVIDNWRTDDTFYWADEWRASLDAFVALAPIKIRDWSIGYPGTYVSFTMSGDYADEVGDLSGVRAWKWLVNDGWDALANPGEGTSCPFTGYCGDETLLDPIRHALANPAAITSLHALFYDCLYAWAKGFEDDLDYWHSEECVREDIELNDYEFYANGTLV